jgi:hypothetical protein
MHARRIIMNEIERYLFMHLNRKENMNTDNMQKPANDADEEREKRKLHDMHNMQTQTRET